jgi:Fe2+ transport system protein B
MKTELKYWGIAVISIALFSGFSLLFNGCATTGTITPKLVEQSAAVDTAISQLQGQQAESAQAAQAVSDTAESIKQTAGKINNPELTAQVNRLNEQTNKLLESQQAERGKTAQVQTNYTDIKNTAGTTLTNQSAQINKLTAQLKLSVTRNWRLGISLAVIIILIVLSIVLKIMGKLPF